MPVRMRIDYTMKKQAAYFLTGMMLLLFTLPVQAVAPTKPLSPGMAVSAELSYPKMYTGDPLLVRVRLTSPRTQRQAYLANLSREAGKEPTASARPSIAANWVDSLAFTLWRLGEDGKRTVVLENLPWAKYALKQIEADDPESLVHRAPWLIPAEIADLKSGRYVLQARWQGKGLVDDVWLDGSDVVTGKELIFAVKDAKTDLELAEHAGHLADADYYAGNYEAARKHGDKALSGLPDMLTSQRINLSLLVVNAAIALKDYADAAERLQKLLDILPPPEQSDMTVALRAQAEALKQIISKTTPTEEDVPEEESPDESPAEEVPPAEE